jgi:hypothetical protein
MASGDPATDAVVDRIRGSLNAAGMDPTTTAVGGQQVVLGRISQFRWRWLATRLHTWVMATSFPAGATPATLDEFLTWAVGHTSTNKGGLPAGVQTGSAVVAVAVVPHADEALTTWAQTPHGSKFGVVAYPVLVDVASGGVAQPARMKAGAVYLPHLRRVVDALVRPAVAR